MNLLKKITAKTVGVTQNGEGFALYGFVKQASVITTNVGSSFKFSGMFRAVTDDGKQFDGMSAYIPGGFDSLVAAQLQSAQDEDKNATLEIALHFKKVEANNPMRSEWQVTTLSKEEKGITALDNLVTKALPAPAATVSKPAAKGAKAAKSSKKAA